MRSYSIIAFCLSLISFQNTLAQPDPITIQFVEAQPIWEHLIWDTTFYNIGNQPDINKFTVVKPHQSYRFGNDLMISSYCTNHRGELYGYILEQLDITTGDIKWQSYSTYYNNGLQDHYKNLYLRPDGNLEMIGIKRHGPYPDSLFFYWNTGGGKSDYVRKIFDYQSGDLKQTIIGRDSVDEIIPSYLTFYSVKFDSSYLVLDQLLKGDIGTFSYACDFYLLNSEQDLVDTIPISTIPYETSDSIGYFTFGQPPFIQKLNDTTFVWLVFQNRSNPEKMKAQLIWISIKNIQDIKVFRRMNIETLIPGNETNFLYFNFRIANHIIYITQPYYDTEIHGYTAYLICLDEDGNILHNIPKCSESNNFYESLSLIYSASDFDYLAAFPSKTGRTGFDILRLNRNSDSYEYISSLTSAFEDEEFARQMEVSKLYEDGLFVIGAYTKKQGPVQNSAVKYYCFNGKDLGMDLETSIDGEVENGETKVFPNPNKGIVNFDFGLKFSGHILLFDLLGKKVGNYTIQDSENYQINLEAVLSGIYFASIIGKDSISKQTVKIIISSVR